MTPGMRIALAGFVATAVAIGIGRFAFTPLLPMMQADAGMSLAAGGWLASANYLGYLLGALMPLAIRMPAANSIRAALLVIGAATFAMGLVEGFAARILLRTLAGIACAWIMIFAFAWSLERLAPLRRPLLNAMAFAGVGAGIAVVGTLCVLFMRAGVTSARAWMLLGLLTFALAAATWTAFAPQGVSSPGAGGPAEAPRWKRAWVWMVFCFGASGFGYIIPATFLPVMAKQAVQDPLIFGLSWPIFGLAVLGSTLLAARLATVVGSIRLWMASQLVMALGVLLPGFWPGIAGIVIAALCIGGTFMVITLLAMQEARKAASPNPERLMAAMTSAFAAGQIAGPICVSFAAGDDGRFPAVLYAAGLLLSISACVLYRVDLINSRLLERRLPDFR